MENRSRFPYGSSYSPLYFREEEWGQDLALMQAAGMNLVRIGDIHGSWDRIEPAEGNYEFQVVGNFYRTAAAFDIDVMVSTGVASPPLWLVTKYPDIPILSSRGERYPLGASYHWACIHHPGFQDAAKRYIRTLADFVNNQPNHFGWQLSNEVGFPFMSAREKDEIGLYCYCDHSQEAFRSWLGAKYETIEAITEAWTWGTTNFVYHDWDQVQAPETKPTSWSSLTRWLDWRLFWQDAFAKFIRWQHDLIRSSDADHPTSVNTFNFKGYDRFGTYMGLDQWKIAKETDHIGYDLYPGSGDKRVTRPEHNSIFLDHGRSVSRVQGREFWVHEIESGPIGGWLLGPQHATDEFDITNMLVECLGHEAKLLLFMPWREWAYQQIRWGALVDLDGEPTTRLEAARSFGAWLQENAPDLLQATVPQGEVAIVESKANAITIGGMDDEELLFRAQRGAYLAYWEQGFSVDFITPTIFDAIDLFEYRHICLPLLGLINKETGKHLSDYVHQGGVLMGFARMGTLDGKAWRYHQLPMEELKPVFGIERIVADSATGGAVTYQGAQYPAQMSRDIIDLQKGTDVLATFDDGSPAVTLNRFGKGAGIYFATHADASVISSPTTNLLREIILKVQSEFETFPRATILDDNERRLELDYHVLEGIDCTWIMFSNYASETKTIEYQMEAVQEDPTSLEMLFPRKERFEFAVRQGVLNCTLTFNPKEVMILKLT